MKSLATNRQKKVLKNFGINFHPAFTSDAAGREIGTIFSDERNAERWRKYLYLTKDFDAESDDLLPFAAADLEDTFVPEDWNGG